MKRLLLVSLVCSAMVAAVVVHKDAISAILGIVVGTPLFLSSFGKGNGIADLRLGNPERKPVDINNSIGLGFAASGIAASVMHNLNFPSSFRIFYFACYVAGIIIALASAARGLAKPKTEQPGNSSNTTQSKL